MKKSSHKSSRGIPKSMRIKVDFSICVELGDGYFLKILSINNQDIWKWMWNVKSSKGADNDFIYTWRSFISFISFGVIHKVKNYFNQNFAFPSFTLE